MREKKNCWEIEKCGREPGGAKAAELGACLAATITACDGLNGGTNGGRICWAIAGTLCGGEVHGSIATKMKNCTVCSVFQAVRKEEGTEFRFTLPAHVLRACHQKAPLPDPSHHVETSDLPAHPRIETPTAPKH